MALNTQISEAAANAQADVVARMLKNGYLRIYDGEQPSSPDAPVTTQNKLAELRFSDFSVPRGGIIKANKIVHAVAEKNGTATWFRALSADGKTAVMDGTVGSSGCNINQLSQVVERAEIHLPSFTHTVPR